MNRLPYPRIEDYRFVETDGRMLFLPLGALGRRLMPDAYLVDPALKDRFESRTAWMTFLAIMMLVGGVSVMAGEPLTLPRLLAITAIGGVAGFAVMAVKLVLELRDVAGQPKVPAPEIDRAAQQAMVRERPPVGDTILVLAPTIWAVFILAVALSGGPDSMIQGWTRPVLLVVLVGLEALSIRQLFARMRDLKAMAASR